MSANKPTYAAVAAKSPDAHDEHEHLAEAPPSYDASVAKVQVPDTGSSSTSAGGPPPSGPQIVYHVVPQGHHVHPHHHHHADQPSMPGQAEQGGLVGRPSPEVARARAMRRFWSAFFVAWAIWIFLGLLIGGGASDVSRNPPGRHGHWDNNGEWHEDRSTTRNWHPKTRTAQAQGAAPTADSAIA
ncbi:hypothetical protein JCM24511_04795 [Saitozyma sp. JCM 24511]|nr:hypothetical protein JCM24511_04795 [Saitozyma sp. JCM 24511]